MSADRRRVTAAIQRIAREDPAIRSLLKEAQARGDQAGAVGVGVSDAERDGLCCDGSTGSSNPGFEKRDHDEGGQDGLNSDDPANLDGVGEGGLSGLTDCVTGEPVCFDGSGFVPPEGWEDPAAPPPDPTYIPGSYYTIPSSSIYGETFRQVCEKNGYPHTHKIDGTFYCKSSGGTLRKVSILKCAPESSYPVCANPTPERADAWPSDGCVNLKSTPAGLVGSKYDPENDGSYSKPMAEIELCDENGNKIGIRPTPDGGWKSIDKLRPDVDGYLYSSSGERIRRISPAEYSDTATR